MLILAAMWAGSWLTRWFASMGLTLPAYIGAMLVAAVLRNVDDVTRLIGISQRTIDDLGATALSLFLVMALMTLKLWDLVGVAVPLAIMLVVQVVAIAVVAARSCSALMGRDYEAAVMSGGFCGFMLGTTANAMANMEALVERYGPAPKAFLVVPMVGAFFIDFTNALIITVCLNIWRMSERTPQLPQSHAAIGHPCRWRSSNGDVCSRCRSTPRCAAAIWRGKASTTPAATGSPITSIEASRPGRAPSDGGWTGG